METTKPNPPRLQHPPAPQINHHPPAPQVNHHPAPQVNDHPAPNLTAAQDPARSNNQFLKPSKFPNTTKISVGEDTYTIGRKKYIPYNKEFNLKNYPAKV
jgi:hypothetical protein